MKTVVRLLLFVLLIGTICFSAACYPSDKIKTESAAIYAAQTYPLTTEKILLRVGFAEGYKPDYRYQDATAILEKDEDGIEKWSVTFSGKISGFKNFADYHTVDEIEKKHFRATADVYKKTGEVRNIKIVKIW